MYRNLNAEIARNGLSKKQIAEHLEITTSALRLKLLGRNRFSLDEAFRLVELIGGNLSFEYLFEVES